MTNLPEMIDVRDNLEYVRRTTDEEDVEATVDSVEERLETFADRDAADRQGVLDAIVNDLIQLQERTDGETAQRVRASRNRIRLYRDARANAENTLVPVELEIDSPDDAATFADASPPDGEAEVRVTVVNEGERRPFDVRLAFTDDEGDVVDTVEADGETVARNEETTVSVVTAVPDTATAYEATVHPSERAAE